MFIRVAKHNITHVQIEEEQHSRYIRRKRCIYILLASCVTQGLGWIFGPLMLVANPDGAEVLGWFFIVFTALEGVWAILLYIVIEREGINDNERDRDNEIELPEVQLDDIWLAGKPDQLCFARSDSPRNSYTNLSTSQAHHRRYQANNSDQL
jgi:hypothetical protein